jgi:LmbE family N-acetylglucosaminyl deacetylase
MSLSQVEQLPRYDVLWLSPHPFDALLSGTARLLRGRAQGLRTLIVTAFGGERHADAIDAMVRLGADHLALDLETAQRRQRVYTSFARRTFGTHDSDATCHDTLRRLLEELGHRTKARDVYAPLGVGGNIDHRLLHEASARVFPVGPGQNVFLYEDRPYALVPGAVRVRLGQLAIRLPPASTDVGDWSWLGRHVWGFMHSSMVRANVHGLREWLRCLWCTTRAWQMARGWQPRKAFGLRLQPVIDPVDDGLARAAQETIGGLGPAMVRLIGNPSSQMRAAAAYARRLRQTGQIERYWLRLPSLENDAVTSLTDPELAPLLP